MKNNNSHRLFIYLRHGIIHLFILLLFLTAPGLCCCTWTFSSCWEWGLLSSCESQASYCSGFSRCGSWALGQEGFSNYGAQASVIMVHRLSCSVAFGIFPDQVLNLCPMPWKADSFLFYFFATLFIF